MKPNSLILKRFQELEERAQKIWSESKKEYDDEVLLDDEDQTSYVVNTKVVHHVDLVAESGWATSCLNLLERVFGENSIHYKNFDAAHLSFVQSFFQSDSPYFQICRSVLAAAREDYEGGYLFDLRGLVQAEVFDDVLEQANELLRADYKDAACVVAGVALETALKQLCSRNDVPHGKLDRMNADLYKAGIYNLVMQKQITAWAERRNRAAHGEWKEYSKADVQDLISGVRRLIGEYL